MPFLTYDELDRLGEDIEEEEDDGEDEENAPKA